jgi:hypothetical protein
VHLFSYLFVDCETEVVQSWEPDPQGSINKVTEFPRIVKEIEEDQRSVLSGYYEKLI